jgi:TolB protein
MRAENRSTALLERPAVTDLDADALFKEARRRRRRRWVIGSCLALLAAAVAAVVGLQSSGPIHAEPPARPTPQITTAAPRPLVNAHALRGRGRLAFVSSGSLWVLDGGAKTLGRVAMPSGLVPISPAFSPDGRWLAFETGSASQMEGSLWIARSNGSGAHRVAGLVLGDAFGWSPRADVYAVGTGPLSKKAPYDQPTTVRLVSPNGALRTLATAPAIIGAAWSPDGSSLAVSTLNRTFVPTLASYSVATDRRTVWTGAPAARQDFIVPAGWWTGWGVVFTVIDKGAVPDGEGSFEDAALYSLSRPGATPHHLGETLTNDSDGAPSATTTGLLTFVSDTGDARIPWNGKKVEVCSLRSMTCSAVPTPPGDVTEDPVWSPSGSTLAYVAAPSLSTSDFLTSTVSSWYDSHTLELYDPSSLSASPVGSAPGATVPIWSSDGTGLLYAAHDGLWLLTIPGSEPVEVSSPLYAQSTPPSFYGEIDWSQQFSWSRGSAPSQCYVVCDPQLAGD